MNNNMLIYGSYARQDFDEESDVDLLTVINESSHKSIFNKINVSHYNRDKIISMTNSGSLFIYHLNQESKIIIDEDNFLRDLLFEKFVKKSNYETEVLFAKTLMLEIFEKYDKTTNYAYANSKISWCIRTIYSGIGANQNLALFSKSKISEFFGKESLRFLGIKKHNNYQKKLISRIIESTEDYIDTSINLSIVFSEDLEYYRADVNKKLLATENLGSEDY